MDLSIVFGLLIIIDLIATRFIPTGKPVTKFAVRSVFFSIETLLIVLLIGSPFMPVYKPTDTSREIWLQILLCAWWIWSRKPASADFNTNSEIALEGGVPSPANFGIRVETTSSRASTELI